MTLAVGLPLLVVAAWLAFRGSLRGQLLLTGTLGFFLYTYMSMCMLTAYNAPVPGVCGGVRPEPVCLCAVPAGD